MNETKLSYCSFSRLSLVPQSRQRILHYKAKTCSNRALHPYPDANLSAARDGLNHRAGQKNI